jgi:hypothetical protein
LFTPPLLTLAEDTETSYRIKGLRILERFLAKCPNAILHSTGLGAIVQETIFPSLMFLPSMTPQEESINILEPAYQALFALIASNPDPKSPERRQLSDDIMRRGILVGFHHASDYPLVVSTLMAKAAILIQHMGVFAAKHIQCLLAMFSAAMTDPFAHMHSQTIKSSAVALEALVTNCWPRMLDVGNKQETIRTIVTCWLNCHDACKAGDLGEQDFSNITDQLRKLVVMVHTIWQSRGSSIIADLKPFLKREPSLAILLPAPTV